MDAAEGVGGEPVIAGSEATTVLEPAEHALDRVAVLAEGFAEATLPQAGALGRDVRDGALALDEVTDAVS